MSITGILLAGGASRRFGAPKAFATYKGRMFYRWAMDVMQEYVDEIVIVSHPDLYQRFSGERGADIIMDVDKYRGKGPVAGLYSVMSQYSATWYCVLPCDMPLLTSSMLNRLVQSMKDDDQLEAVMPFVGGRMYPLTAIYHQNVLPRLQQNLDEGRHKVSEVTKHLAVAYLGEEELGITEYELQNINSQADHHQLMANETTVHTKKPRT